MNNPIQALAQMAMNRISSDPNFQRNPQAKAFMDIMQRGDVTQGEQMARNLCQSFGVSEQEAFQQAKSLPRMLARLRPLSMKWVSRSCRTIMQITVL